MKIEDFDNLFLGATDLEKAKLFYHDILGLEIKFDFSDKGMIAFKVGNNEPAIILKDLTRFPATNPTIWFKVDSVHKCYDEMKNKGIVFLSEPYKILTGRAVEFKDPTGNILGITDYIN
ncbi:MAG: VOC family protein [Ginsengibacter sp.]